jgi:hypothetical protein
VWPSKLEHAARLVQRPTLTASTRAGGSEATAGTNKWTFEQKTDDKKDAPPLLKLLDKKAPYKGLGADSEEKREPVSNINTTVVDSLKALDPNRPIREPDIACFI